MVKQAIGINFTVSRWRWLNILRTACNVKVRCSLVIAIIACATAVIYCLYYFNIHIEEPLTTESGIFIAVLLLAVVALLLLIRYTYTYYTGRFNPDLEALTWPLSIAWSHVLFSPHRLEFIVGPINLDRNGYTIRIQYRASSLIGKRSTNYLDLDFPIDGANTTCGVSRDGKWFYIAQCCGSWHNTWLAPSITRNGMLNRRQAKLAQPGGVAFICFPLKTRTAIALSRNVKDILGV